MRMYDACWGLKGWVFNILMNYKNYKSIEAENSFCSAHDVPIIPIIIIVYR